jgi:hypothetical protein
VPLAAAFVHQFMHHKGAIPLSEIDKHLIAHGHMPATASQLERPVFRNRYLRSLRQASTSRHMRNEDIEPFQVHCSHRSWRMVSLAQHIQQRKEARKVRTQAKTSRLKLRHLMEAVDPMQDQKAYLLVTMTGKVLDIHENVLHTLDEQLAKGLADMALIFDRTEAMLRQAQEGLPPESAGGADAGPGA